ncbi:hypothetical protein AB3X91_34335 [Paraburkholderia sp. BR14263]|uniref:hypothetical protein n=1 Tax=unclassified Paraburkholderia TaxID=2615204 RepID=UPI0034CE0F1A
MKTDVTQVLLQFVAGPAVFAVFIKYLLDRFDGALKERHGAKSLAFVCWYGPHRRPRRFPHWVTSLASVIRRSFRRERKPIDEHAPSSRKTIAFIFNNGRVPLTTDDLFTAAPLKLVLQGDGELTNVKVAFETDQTAAIKLGQRAFLRRPKNYATERSLMFSYMAPGHGVAIEVEYRASKTLGLSLQGPVKGMRNSVQQQILFEVDIENDERRRRRRRVDTWKLWVGGLMMAGAAVTMLLNARANSGRSAVDHSWQYWSAMLLMTIGEWTALSAWYRLKQRKKVPSRLRYWEPQENVPAIPVGDQVSS